MKRNFTTLLRLERRKLSRLDATTNYVRWLELLTIGSVGAVLAALSLSMMILPLCVQWADLLAIQNDPYDGLESKLSQP